MATFASQYTMCACLALSNPVVLSTFVPPKWSSTAASSEYLWVPQTVSQLFKLKLTNWLIFLINQHYPWTVCFIFHSLRKINRSFQLSEYISNTVHVEAQEQRKPLEFCSFLGPAECQFEGIVSVSNNYTCLPHSHLFRKTKIGRLFRFQCGETNK